MQYYEPTPEAAVLMQTLSQQLKTCKGRKVYGYLPKEIKETVDQIVAAMAKDDGIAELYAEWNKVNREKLSLYREKREPDLPLEDNPEFRKIKNQIIQAALQIEPQAMDAGQIGYVFNEDRTAAVRVPAGIPAALKSLACALVQMLAEGQQQKLNRLNSQVDRRLRSKIEEKKAAHGLKTDRSGQSQGWEQSM